MTFKEASEKLGRVANGKYHMIQYSKATHCEGNVKEQCQLYVDGFDWEWDETWEKAFDKLKSAMFDQTPE
jgi:hypothetical protein